MLASFAALTGRALAESDGPDSFNILPTLLGAKTDPFGREYLVTQSNEPATVALRKGSWKYVKKAPRAGRKVGGELYNLANDIGEVRNLADIEPALLAEMAAKLAQIKNDGRSRP